MLLIFVPKITNRILYTFEVCFNNIIKLDYRLTDNIEIFESYNKSKFCYSNEYLVENLCLLASNLLFSDYIIKKPKYEIIDSIPCFFPCKAKGLPKFDFFSAVFWYITRMEEYNFIASKRFEAINSLSNELNLIEKPIVNIWTEMFLKNLTNIYPEIKYKKTEFKFTPTIDVDSAFKYKYKGFVRNAYWFLRDFLSFKFDAIKERFYTITNRYPDVWNCFDEINLLHAKYNFKPIYFFLVGIRTKYDKNISIRKKAMKKIIRNLHDNEYEIGLHSSWLGTQKENVWEKEKTILENIIENKIEKIRQHYIFVKFSYNFRKYSDMGFREDYSLIYPDRLGFRLGTTVSVPFFDLHKNEKTKLTLFPSVIMDVSLKNYEKKTIKESKESVDRIINYYREYGGNLFSLWHNESLSKDKEWIEWREVYEYLLEKLSLSK